MSNVSLQDFVSFKIHVTQLKQTFIEVTVRGPFLKLREPIPRLSDESGGTCLVFMIQAFLSVTKCS